MEVRDLRTEDYDYKTLKEIALKMLDDLDKQIDEKQKKMIENEIEAAVTFADWLKLME